MRTKSVSSWGRSQFFAVSAIASAAALSQVACMGAEEPVDQEFQSAVTKHDLAGGGGKKPGGVVDRSSKQPYCDLLQVAGDPHPPHGCAPLSCESCQNIYWTGHCFWVE